MRNAPKPRLKNPPGSFPIRIAENAVANTPKPQKNKKAFLPVDDFDIFPIFEKSSLLFSLDMDCVKYVKTHYVATEHNGFHFIEIQIIYLLLDFLLVRQLLMDKLSLCR